MRVRFVKAATLDRLVDALVTDDGELESTFVNVFLGKKIKILNTKKLIKKI